MTKVKHFVKTGWPNKNKNEGVRSYFARRTEISEFDGLLLWGTRVIIAPKGRGQMLNELHEGHTGMSKTKSMAMSYIGCPNMDRDIESRIECCEICQMTQSSPLSFSEYSIIQNFASTCFKIQQEALFFVGKLKQL